MVMVFAVYEVMLFMVMIGFHVASLLLDVAFDFVALLK